MSWSMCGLQEHEIRFYCLLKKVNFSLLALSDFFCRHAYAYAHMRIIRHESASSASAWPSLVDIVMVKPLSSDIYLEESLSWLQPSSPKQTAFIPTFSQVSATLPCSKSSPCTTGTWYWDCIDRTKKAHRKQQFLRQKKMGRVEIWGNTSKSKLI